jgi:hypothetical protein
MQRHWHSVLEAIANTMVGFGVAMLSVAYLFPLAGVHLDTGQNFNCTVIMTVISFARSYVVRRVFNYWNIRRGR